RGQLYQCTDEAGLAEHLRSSRKLYCGFDPTASSLTIGNLVPLMLLKRFQLAGHTPYILAGGATGLIGDPSGKEAERSLRTREEIQANVDGQCRIYRSLFDVDSDEPNAAKLVNNIDWIEKISWLESLRDIGKHFSVNQMIQRDSVKNRLEGRDQGISYTEFSYVLLQAYDFLHLFREEGVTLQCAGSDQWGNIVSGCDLIRRHSGDEDDAASKAFGLTAPLLVKADGKKFGKTETGAIWLSADRTSPYRYYQFWLNAADEDVIKFLKIFTLLGQDEIEALEQRHAAEPFKREAQRTLAREATAILHGEEAMEKAEAAGQALFSGDLASLDLETLNEVLESAPSSEHSKAQLGGEGLSLIDLLAETSLAKSKSEARTHLKGGAVSINGRKVGEDETLRAEDLLHGQIAAIRRGKKNWHVTRWG
ncbi:MAG: tyrosine--tRNA ligase, partial [Phycisphaerales bacterium]